VNADLAGTGPRGQDALVRDLERATLEEAPRKQVIPPPASTPPAGPREYTVRADESLWRIAERELGSGARYKEIATLNGLADSDHIVEGMQLKLPAKDGVAPPAKPSPTGTPKASDSAPGSTPLPRRGTADTTERLAGRLGTRSYVVKSGDSLGLIAQRELGSARRMGEIKELNAMTSDVVKLGTTLVLPGERAVSDAPVIASAMPKPASGRAQAPPKERRATGAEFFVR
jgi:nucleoid-associated protein YgaU